MKITQLLGIALCVLSIFLMVPLKIPSIVPTKPLDPSLYALQSQVKTIMVGPTAEQDATTLEGVMRSAANQFVLDEKRPAPYYKTGDDLKWTVRSIGDLSFPLGWSMKERYPQLPSALAAHMESRLGSEVKKETVVQELRNMADVLASI